MEQVSVEIICKNLQSSERALRQKSLNQLLKIASKESDSEIVLAEWFDETYLHLIKCYSDRFESCRELTISVVTEFILNINPINSRYVECIIPVMRRRIGMTEIVEESEELRLKLLEQLHEIIRKLSASNGDDQFEQIYDDIVDIVLKTLTDSFASVHRKSCEIIKSLADATPSFSRRAESLVDPLIVLLNHRQYATRAEAIETLTVVCLHVNTKTEAVVKSIVSISPLLMDAVPFVRRECGRAGCRLLLELRDRYSLFQRILPLVLCCLNDDSKDTQDEIQGKFVECGKKFFDENELEFRKLSMIESQLPCDNYFNIVSAHRPTLGCRKLVQQSLGMTSIVAHELQDWKEEVRVHSLKLLWQIVLHSEKLFSAKFVEFLPLLCKCCQDDDKSVVNEATRVCTLIGRLMAFEDWFEHAMKAIESHPSSLGVLRCLAALLRGTSPDSRTVTRISKTIIDLKSCHSIDDEYQNVLLELAVQLIENNRQNSMEKLTIEDSGDKIDKDECALFEILVRILCFASASNESKIPEKVSMIIDRFWSIDKRTFFYEKSFASIINSVDVSDCEYTDASESVQLLCGCLKSCSLRAANFDVTLNLIASMMQKGHPSARLKILTAISLALTEWTSTKSLVAEDNLLDKLVDRIVLPRIEWQPGRSAEAIRTAALQVLVSIAENAESEATQIFPKLLKHFIALAEDNSAITRAYAMRCLLKLRPLSYDEYKDLVTPVLSGIDDPCSNVRTLAVECISHLQLDPNSEELATDSYRRIITTILKKLILHLDEPNLTLRPIVLNSIRTVAAANKMIFCEEIDAFAQGYSNCLDIDEIKSQLNS